MKLKKNAQPVREGRGNLLCRGCFLKREGDPVALPLRGQPKKTCNWENLGKSGKNLWKIRKKPATGGMAISEHFSCLCVYVSGFICNFLRITVCT